MEAGEIIRGLLPIFLVDGLLCGLAIYLLRFTSKPRWGGGILVIYALAKVGELVNADFVTVGFSISLGCALFGAILGEIVGRIRAARKSSGDNIDQRPEISSLSDAQIEREPAKPKRAADQSNSLIDLRWENRRRRFIKIWTILFVIWLGAWGWDTWDRAGPYLWPTEAQISIETERIDENGFLTYEPDGTPRKSRVSVRVPDKKLSPGGNELTKLRAYFPTYSDRSDKEFSQYIWELTQTEKAEARIRRIETGERILVRNVVLVLLPAIVILLVGGSIIGLMRRYAPNGLSVFIKRVMVLAILWIICAITWVTEKQENGDLEDAFDEQYLVLYVVPPIILIVGAVLWKWASRPPLDNNQKL